MINMKVFKRIFSTYFLTYDHPVPNYTISYEPPCIRIVVSNGVSDRLREKREIWNLYFGNFCVVIT